MSHQLAKRANHTVEVTAELDDEAVTRERQAILQSYRRRAKVPGFRPGKAPLAAVRARFGTDIETELEEHLAGLLIREVFEQEEDLEPLTRPNLNEAAFDDDGSFRITAEFEVRPRYELPELDGVELPEVSLQVAEAEIDQELEKVADENATWEPADDETAADGILVEADLNGEMEESDQDPYHEQGARFVLGSESVPKQINEALQGAHVGDQRVAEHRFPDDDGNQERAGKTVRYTIDVNALKRKAVPPVDDDLAKTIGLESLEELRKRINEALERNKRAMRKDSWQRFLLDHLERGIDVNELPSSLVQSAVREDLNRFAFSMAMQGMAPDSDQVDWQEMAAKFEPGARKRALDMLVIEQLAEQWEVAVPESEVDAFLSVEAQRLGIPPAEHKANLAKEDRLEGLRHSARSTATIDELIRRGGGEVD
jgi:trigger factor